MPNLSQMQGVSAHLETLKAKDSRRHPAHCIFAEGKGANRVCTCPQCGIYLQHCSTAKWCEYYEKRDN